MSFLLLNSNDHLNSIRTTSLILHESFNIYKSIKMNNLIKLAVYQSFF
jgi:hypothetical protein